MLVRSMKSKSTVIRSSLSKMLDFIQIRNREVGIVSSAAQSHPNIQPRLLYHSTPSAGPAGSDTTGDEAGTGDDPNQEWLLHTIL